MLNRLLACIVLFGCATQQASSVEMQAEINICIDTDYTQEEAGKIVAGVLEWAHALQGVVAIQPKRLTAFGNDSCRVTFFRATSATDWVTRDSPTTLGRANAIGGKYIWLVADRKPEWLSVTAAHEIGHTFGLRHYPTGLMHPRLSGTETVGRREAILAAFLLGKQSATTVRVVP